MHEPYVDLSTAATSLARSLGLPAGEVSISTYLGSDGSRALRVFLTPSYAYAKGRVPSEWAGFEVTCLVAPQASAGTGRRYNEAAISSY